MSSLNSEMTYRQGWLRHSSRGVIPPLRHALPRLLRLILPNEGWVTFLLVLMVAVSVTWSVESAEWAKTPGLTYVMLTGAITGMALAKLRIHGLILQGMGLLAGVFTVLWFILRLVDAGSWRDGVTVLVERLKLWYAAAATEGISSDSLPFAVALVVLVWLLGYVCTWYAFRYRNIWVPLVVAGLGILTNLSYLPTSLNAYFVLFLLFSFLAVGWMSALELRRHWSRQHIRHSSLVGALGIYHGLWFGIMVVLAATLLPVELPRPSFLKKGYEYLRWPVDRLQGDFNRLFAAVPARKPMSYRVFDSTLPFQGTISLSDEVAFTVRSSRPSYWRVRSYPTYTSRGWVSGATQMVPLQWQPVAATPERYQERQEVVQHVRLNYSPRLLAAAGVIQGSAMDVEVEVPVPASYDISITDPTFNPALPSKVQSLGRRLRALAAQEKGGLTEPLVQDTLPKEMELAGVRYDAAGVMTGVTIRRPTPLPLDVLSVRSQKRLFSSDEYTFTSNVSVATAAELRQVGEGYPGWVSDIYLQLPDTLPKRVIDLARRLTAEAGTPYDKAEAIESYLHTLPYTTNVPAPAYDADGVDHFLFNLGAGYSDYFGSAMAVMLRAVGVPARMAVGYGLSEVGKDGNIIVRDRNGHGWTEVFFSGYGWVEFEPTPGHERPFLARDTEELQQLLPGGNGLGDENLDDLLAGTFRPGGRGLRYDSGRGWMYWTGAGAGGVAVALLAAFMALRWLLGTPTTTTGVYGKMARLSNVARLGPFGGQTPKEYGSNLASRLPEISTEVATVVEVYTRSRYGNRTVSDGEEALVIEAWRKIRRVLFLRTLRRHRQKRIMVPSLEARP